MWDVFISHASEDKESIARPLAAALEREGLRVWLDANELKVGHSLRAKLDEGLGHAQFGVVVLSPAFFAKKWPTIELDALFALEDPPEKVILPVWHDLDERQVRCVSPILASRIGVSTSRGMDHVLIALVSAIRATRNETDGPWIRFDRDGWPDLLSIHAWLTTSSAELARPRIAWDVSIEQGLARLVANRERALRAEPIPGKRGWYRFGATEARHFELESLIALPDQVSSAMDVTRDRLVGLASGLRDYGRGFEISEKPARNFLFLVQRHLRKQVARASSLLGVPSEESSDYVEDIRALIRSGTRELASAHVMYVHSPDLSDRLERATSGFRIWAPRAELEEAQRRQRARDWYLPHVFFEQFAVPQIELRLFLERRRQRLEYSAHLERWYLSSFKDENLEQI